MPTTSQYDCWLFSDSHIDKIIIINNLNCKNQNEVYFTKFITSYVELVGVLT